MADSSGTVATPKAKVGATDFQQKHSTDYCKTYDLVVKLISIRFSLAILAHFDLELH